MKEEIGRTKKRLEQLAEGSAKNHQCFAEPTEKQVTAFVNHQIDVVEKEKTAAAEGALNKNNNWR